MALKKQFEPLVAFSMSSMADVIFLLLIFFMITSTLIIPSALDVNLPEGTEQTLEKPQTEVYLDSVGGVYLVENRMDSLPEGRLPRPVSDAELQQALMNLKQAGKLQNVALYADSTATYAGVVRILDMAARQDIKMVLATHPVSSPLTK